MDWWKSFVSTIKLYGLLNDQYQLTEGANDAEAITKIVNAGKSTYDAYKKGVRFLVGTSIIKGLADAVGRIAKNPILSKRFADAVGGLAKKPICLKHVNMPAFTSAAMDLIEGILAKAHAKIASSVAASLTCLPSTKHCGLIFSVLVSIYEVQIAINNGDSWGKLFATIMKLLVQADICYIAFKEMEKELKEMILKLLVQADSCYIAFKKMEEELKEMILILMERMLTDYFIYLSAEFCALKMSLTTLMSFGCVQS